MTLQEAAENLRAAQARVVELNSAAGLATDAQLKLEDELGEAISARKKAQYDLEVAALAGSAS